MSQARTPCPVEIRGITYPSIKEAARQLGMNDATLRHHLNNGTIDRVGKGKDLIHFMVEGTHYVGFTALGLGLELPANNIGRKVRNLLHKDPTCRLFTYKKHTVTISYLPERYFLD